MPNTKPEHKSIFEPPTFSSKQEEQKFLKHRLAIGYRILAAHGLSDHVAGHITVRDPIEPTSFWVGVSIMYEELI